LSWACDSHGSYGGAGRAGRDRKQAQKALQDPCGCCLPGSGLFAAGL